MKYHRFLLFLTKATLTIIITFCIIGSTIHKASALTNDPALESAASETEYYDGAVISDTETDPTLSNENADDSAPEADIEEDTSQPEEAEDVISQPEETEEEVSQPEEAVNQDSEDAKQEEDTPEDPQQGDNEVEHSDMEETDPSDSGNVTDSGETSDSGDTADKMTDSESHQASESTPNLSTQSETPTSSKVNIKDESSDAIYVKRSYNPSETFIDLKDRIKYNAALPLDNIPAFITQEMIIGALKCQDETGYPASVTIAQIIQESGFGKYGPGGEDCQGLSYLAYQYCNLFGIKGTGTAGSVNMRTGEQTSSGEYYTITAGFRVYNTYTECIEDRTKLIQRAYSDLITGVTDANTFAVQIGSRWATSLQYSQDLIEQMEYYDLYRLDRMTLMDFSEMIGQFSDPCPGSYLTSSFGYRDFDHKFHKGIDLGTNGEILPVYAAESGTVVRAEYDSLAGNWVLIDHGNGLVTKYMHFSHTFVKEGQEVTKGQQIGLTGTTGRSTGIHLHFQVEENGVAVDPTSYLSTIE